MNNTGTKEIRTERLLLRKIKKSDYKDIYKYASNEEVAKYVTWPVHKSIKDSKALCKMWAEGYKKENTYRWAIVYNGVVIGVTDVVKFVHHSAELGWCIDSPYWNKGFVTEAASAVRDYLFQTVGVDNLFAAHITENIGSGRVMQKIGMKEVSCEEFSVMETKARYEFECMPISFYRMTREEWQNLL